MKKLIIFMTMTLSLNIFAGECTEKKAINFIKKDVTSSLFKFLYQEKDIKKVYKRSLKVSLPHVKGDFHRLENGYAVGIYSFKVKLKTNKIKDYFGYSVISLSTCEMANELVSDSDELVEVSLRPAVATRKVH